MNSISALFDYKEQFALNRSHIFYHVSLVPHSEYKSIYCEMKVVEGCIKQ
jgi:hypothetical protein